MKTISALTLGCKVNQYDTDAMLTLFEQAGYRVVDWGTPSDIALINTCTVTGSADRKSKNAIRKAAGRGSRILVCGCLAQKERDTLLEMGGVSWVIGTADRSRAVAVVEEDLAAACERPAFEDMQIGTPRKKTRAFIKIQEGCSNFCSYCIIPYVRGRPHSRTRKSVLEEVSRLTRAGVPEIVLTGTDLASYSDEAADLADLILEIEKGTDAKRLRLGSLEPGVFTPAFTEKLARSHILCPHFHLSLQSGSASVLKAMNRHYTSEDYLGQVRCLREFFDNPSISTDIMTGFPGESSEDHQASMAAAREAAFSRLHVFPYSERPGTAAVSLPGKVPVSVRKERALALIALGKELEKNYARSLIGSVQQVLLEETAEGKMEGYCERYVRIRTGGSSGEIRHVTPVREENCILLTDNEN